MRTKLLAAAAILPVILVAAVFGLMRKGAGEANDIEQAQKLAESGQPGEQSNVQSENENGDQAGTNQGNGSRNGNSSAAASPTLPPNTLPLKVELIPRCATRGTVMTLRIETRRTASLALGVSYKDAVGPYWVGNADDQGRFIYRWMIEPDVPMGDGSVLVGAGDYSPGPDEYSAYSTGESAREIVHFRVAAKC